MKIHYSDSLVIGGGLAGLRVAVGLQKRGHQTTLLSLVPVKRSHSCVAAGGMQASLGNSIKGEGDNEDVHFEDTVKGSDWGCDQHVARMFTQVAPKAIRELAAWGVPWNRIKAGDREVIVNSEKVTITEKEEADGLINARDFGGTKKWRTNYVSDATGHAMIFTVANEALHHNVNIKERKEVLSFIHDGSVCIGVVVRDLIDGELEAYVAKATCISTGGYGRIYLNTTNAVICEGTCHGAALETGVVPLSNMEAVQFHPTGLFPSGVLMTEGCRGDGGILLDKDGYRFMPDYEPEKKELASRDVVSRRMEEHIRKGKGVKTPIGEHLWLDISILGRKHIEKNLRDVQEACIDFLGIDPAVKGSWIPVRPMQHYSMGGVRTNYKGETALKGLFSCGEAACWDMHGFNRLGGNSVAETVVSGMIVSEYMADYCDDNVTNVSTQLVEEAIKNQQKKIDAIFKRNPTKENVFAIREKMKHIMTEKVGIFRNEKDLSLAVKELETLNKEVKQVGLTARSRNANPELVEILRVEKMLKLALVVAKGAYNRTESRGAHNREDYPKRDDKNWLKRTMATWKEGSEKPIISYEDLDIMKMEIPPGFRGYGKKGNTIENPMTAKRQKEVDAIKDKMKGADRYALQEALMSFELPLKYKKHNERIGNKG